MGFQVTAQRTSAKVRETLEAILPRQEASYSEIRILVIGEKQGSYTFDGEPFEHFRFTPDMVWDFTDVCSRTMSLSIDRLEDLARYISSETRRVRVELEIPDEEGRFPTSIEGLIEVRPHPQLSDASKITAYYQDQGFEANRAGFQQAIAELSTKLTALPRLTREVFKFIVERSDKPTSFSRLLKMSEPKLRRIYRGNDLDGDLALLSQCGLLRFNDAESHERPAYWSIHFPADEFGWQDFCEFTTDRHIDLRKPLVILDFSDF